MTHFSINMQSTNACQGKGRNQIQFQPAARTRINSQTEAENKMGQLFNCSVPRSYVCSCFKREKKNMQSLPDHKDPS